MKNKLILMALPMMLVLLVPTFTNAAEIQINVGGTLTTIVDEGSGDLYPGVGVILANGTSNGWTFSMNTGITKPILGSATNPSMDLNYWLGRTNSGSPTSASILFTDTDFTLTSLSSFFEAVGGIQNEPGYTSTFKIWVDPSNNPFGTSILVSSIGPLGTSAYNADASGNPLLTLNQQFSMTLEVDITSNTTGGHSGGDITESVPEPSLTLLLGLGFGAVSLITLRRRK